MLPVTRPLIVIPPYEQAALQLASVSFSICSMKKEKQLIGLMHR
jgi:hypothetical protein